MKTLLTTSILFTALTTSAYSQRLDLPAMLTDHAVLQRDKPIRLWGWADVGATVSVNSALGEASTTADAQGVWLVELPPSAAVAEPTSLTFTSDQGGEKTITNILVGDVWLCSGQSNMAFTVGQSTGGPEAIQALNDPLLRLIRVETNVASKPHLDVPTSWTQASGDNASRFSAVGFFFGQHLRRETGVPIGLIDSSYGGTAVEGWISPERHQNDPGLEYYRLAMAKLEEEHPGHMDRFEELFQENMRAFEANRAQLRADLRAGNRREDSVERLGQPTFQPGGKHLAGVLFNAMIHPLTNANITGVIWYQGEANSNFHAEHYATSLSVLVADWRDWFRDDHLPFIITQLPNIRAEQSSPTQRTQWAPIREAQFLTAAADPKIGIANTIDLGDPENLHPREKRGIAERLALQARKIVYGDSELIADGPMVESTERTEEGILVTFQHTGEGLRLREGADSIKGFVVTSADGRSRFAEAEIVDSTTVLVRVPDPAAITEIRYNWADNPVGRLENSAGIPAFAFRQYKPLN